MQVGKSAWIRANVVELVLALACQAVLSCLELSFVQRLQSSSDAMVSDSRPYEFRYVTKWTGAHALQ